jgi:riboflavin synthase
MFTGIVAEAGRVRAVAPRAGGVRVEIEAGPAVLEGLGVGDSVAVNGCCLTAVEIGDTWWAADAVIETVERSTLGDLDVGDRVNLERPVTVAGRLDGHLVQGHVDGVAVVAAVDPLPDGSTSLALTVPGALLRYVVEKGSVTLDGVSLTVAGLDEHGFRVAVIPHTAEVTTLGSCGPGDRVNIEVDVVAKYVERLAAPYRHAGQP